MEFYSPLRYPGGKGKLATLLKDVIVENGINDAIYIEPYAGGAAAALSLLMEEYVWKIVINDIDKAVHAFWWCVLNHTEWLLKKIQETSITMDEWYRQKAIYETAENYDDKDVGFSAFFLNRTNRSGILKGGVIGGHGQQGKYKLNSRFNKNDLSKRIKKIARRKHRIRLFNLDAADLLKQIARTLSGAVLFYFDPPYYKKGCMLYTNHYNHENHFRIAKAIRRLRFPWIVTYDDVPEISKIYKGCASVQFSLTYTAHLNRTKATEVMFYSGIELPNYMSLMKLPYFSRDKVIDLGYKGGHP